jgi:hypothetical protein
MDSHRATPSVPQDIPTGRPETPPTDCTYPTSWNTESGCSDSDSLFDSDKENCPPQLESEVEPRSTRPSSRISTDSNDSDRWSIPPPSSKGIKGKGRTFHDKRGISYTEFKTFYADTRNANALRKQIYEEGTRWSTALLGLLQGFQATVPNDEEFLRVIRAFEHADREMSFLQERFAAYAADMSSVEGHLARTLLANASKSAEGVANVLRIEKEFATSLFRSRQCSAKALLDVAKGYGLDASGRKVMGARPGSASYSSTVCQECGKTGHPTIDCFDYACPKCLNIRPRHFIDTCPFKIKRTESSASMRTVAILDTTPSIVQSTYVDDASRPSESVQPDANPSSPPGNSPINDFLGNPESRQGALRRITGRIRNRNSQNDGRSPPPPADDPGKS